MKSDVNLRKEVFSALPPEVCTFATLPLSWKCLNSIIIAFMKLIEELLLLSTLRIFLTREIRHVFECPTTPVWISVEL